jgi:class 3 adenylate cyclase
MRRTTATVLFTDLVSSTELSIAHGAAFDEVRRTHDALLRNAVGAAGGTVIKGLGDGIMAAFDAVGDAVTAARAAQAGIHRLNHRGTGPALSIRVGLSLGDVTYEDDGDCFGEPVIEAARLCAIAEGDQILATALVKALVGRQPDGFVDLGRRALKGLPEPVEVVEVRWERPEASATPLPARLASAPTDFVGRAAELAALHGAYQEVTEHGAVRAVLVGGEPGVGKTTMVSQAIRLWFDRGAAVAMGRCEEDVRAPYRPFIDVLEHLVASAPPEVLADHVERHGAALLPLAPSLASRVGDLPPLGSSDLETERFQLFAAAADLLTALATRAPLVIFLDDLHWADAGTVSLLRVLATQPEPARLLLLGTFRSDELAGDHPMAHALAAFRRVPAVTRLQLSGLQAPDILELVERWTGEEPGAPAERLARDLAAETGGNAFFVTEVMRHLADTGQLDGLAGPLPSAGPLVPESVLEVLAQRVAQLGAMADGVLATAAVIGQEFTLGLVSAVTGLDDAKLLGVLDEAAAAALVTEVRDAPGRFAFTHALVQHAILLNAGATREAALHRRVAEVLEADDSGAAPVDELARHWLQATNTSDNRRARDWARQAGDAAIAALAPADAAAYYRQALLLHDQLRDDDVATRIDLLTQLGTAERQSGDPEHRDTLLKACRLARRAGDTARLAEAALANNSGTFSTFQGVDPEQVEMLEAALAGATDPARRALLTATLANELTYTAEFERRRGLADEALRLARATGDGALVLRVSNLVFYAVWVPETLDERLALTEESLALADAVGDPLSRYWASISAHLNLVQAGRVEEADPLLDLLDELTDRLAQPALQWRARHTRAARLILRGDPDRAEQLALQAFELGDRAGAPEASVYGRSQEMSVAWQRGTLAELAAGISGRSPRSPNALASLALIFTEGGRADEVVPHLDAVAAGALADLPHNPAYLSCLALFAEAAIRLEHAAAASVLHEGLAPFAGQIGFDGVMVVGSLQHHLGGLARVLGRPDEAVDRLNESAALHRRIGAPFFEAGDRLELGWSLHERGAAGDAARAREELRAALALAQDHGYAAVRDRAAGRLAALDR